MTPSRPIGIDLFAGAGGLSLGFEQAGFDVVAAIELDPVHAAVHAYNFPQCAVLARSVIGLSGSDIRKATGIGRRTVDVVFGGAPCQGFSLMGQRALDDPRNKLVSEFVRLVAEINPRYFVFENVKGITVGRQLAFLDELIRAFDSVGYEVRLPWKVLNAVDYGVPQDRERLILVGARRGLRLPTYPEATTRGAGVSRGNLFLPEGPSCADALGDLPDAESYPELWKADTVLIADWRGPHSAYAREMRCLSNDPWHYGYLREWDRAILTSSFLTVHTDISRRRFSRTLGGSVEPISRFFRLPAAGVSNTLRAGTDSARGAFTSPRPIHYLYPRVVTVREMARLHGFPDWFRLHVTKWHGARQIGNAVPPPLARAVAARILDALEIVPVRPCVSVPLGDPALLAMDMQTAAGYWGVPVPVGRRDRKSGARKRRQHEIEMELGIVPAV